MDRITDVQCIHDKYEIHHGIEQASGCLPCHGDVDLIISYSSRTPIVLEWDHKRTARSKVENQLYLLYHPRH